MKIPSVFYGTFKKVKAEVKKLLTKIKRGIPLEDIFSPFELLDINDYPTKFFPRANGEYMIPNNLIWLDRMWSMSGTEEHFILSQFWQAYDMYCLDNFIKVSREDRGKYYIEEEKTTYKLMAYFADTEWGCCSLHTSEVGKFLNNSKCYEPTFEEREQRVSTGIIKVGIDPDIALLILRSTVKYWDNFISYGQKFYTGGSECESFPTATSRYDLIKFLGYDTKEFPIKVVGESRADPIFFNGGHYHEYGDMKKICEKYSIIEKLESDEDFRRKAYEGTLYKPTYKAGHGWY